MNKSKLKPCNCLKKIYDNEKGYYVKCIYCEEKSKYFKDYDDALELKRENIRERRTK